MGPCGRVRLSTRQLTVLALACQGTAACRPAHGPGLPEDLPQQDRLAQPGTLGGSRVTDPEAGPGVTAAVACRGRVLRAEVCQRVRVARPAVCQTAPAGTPRSLACGGHAGVGRPGAGRTWSLAGGRARGVAQGTRAPDDVLVSRTFRPLGCRARVRTAAGCASLSPPFPAFCGRLAPRCCPEQQRHEHRDLGDDLTHGCG